MKSDQSSYVLFFIILLCISISACDSDNLTDPAKMDFSDKKFSGGETTVFDATSHAFSTPAPNLSEEGLAKHLDGDVEFEAVFVTVPAEVNPGLGPVYNNISCINCHARDGRGRAPTSGEKLTSMLFRVSLPNPGGDVTHGPVPVPGFGTQLNNRAIFGVPPEGTVTINYTEGELTTSDGVKVYLRTPSYEIKDAYQPLPDDVEISPRVAPVVFGLGLLEAIPESTILALADEDDQDGDGISGKANYVWDVQKNGLSLGRFGWKANQPTLIQQVASAYHDDIGITTSLLPIESSDGQSQYDGRGDDPELSDEILDVVTFYVQTLAVPARRNLNDPIVQRGEELFESAKCSGCHIPTLETGSLSGVPEVSNQTIQPFTDLLLHDMGPGLADYRPDFLASGSEWRTPPLWGIGLVKVVNGHTNFLHDGRARGLLEAILWHGGEAEQSREAVQGMSASDRDALIAFLESL
ncbi:thiol oxidoreductase [Candidatus Poribacteria bacterium]|nr:MAG: thiol oxidoreductase [Candidatus Poribacteria bacterium]